MNGSSIGIIGGGQLGRMLTLAAKPLGFHVIVIDTTPNSPAAQVGAEQILTAAYDETAIRQLADRADYLTVEFEEGLDPTLLEHIASLGKPVNPAPQTIRLIQDKLAQKEFLEAHDIPTAKFAEFTSQTEATALLRKFGGKMVIKTRRGGYDGNGNMVISSPAGIKRALTHFAGRPLYAEKFVPFKKELAVMIARGLDGSIIAYPVVETIQARNICLEVLAPAPISKALQRKALALALKIASYLEGAGVFGIEMFLTKTGKILINEIAPRVHNSGHYTIEASRTSQFEQHIRAITGLPLGSTELMVPAAVMVNILGEQIGPAQVGGLDDALAIAHTSVHIYGKAQTKIDRKMGHITATAATIELARKRARSARKKLTI